MNVFQSYLHNLIENPERIDSLLMWFFCTGIIWMLIFSNRKEMISGMKGLNLLWEGGEQVTYYSLWAFIPILFRVAFFKESSSSQLIALYFITGLIAYQVFGRYIFDWALAFKSGLSAVPIPVKEVEATKVTTTTETTVK